MANETLKNADREAEEARAKKFLRMTTEPVEKLIGKLAIPTVISMLVSSFYNLVDTLFVGRLEDENATAAVSAAFSLMAIIQAFGFFCGHGSGNFISRALGSRETEKAERMASTGFFVAGIIGGLILLFGLIFLRPFAILLGAKDSMPVMQDYTVDYMRYILLAAPIMCMQIVLNNQLRFQGNAFYAMIGISSGAVLNIGLDAWLVPKMGVEGAAVATAASQCVSFLLLLIGMLRSDNLKIRLKNFTPTPAYLKEIARGGAPSLCRQGLGSISNMCINHVAGDLGSAAAVAAIGIVQRIMMFASSAMIGFGQGFQPVCGFNYGAKKYERVHRAFWFCVMVSTGFLLVVAVGAFVFAEPLVTFMQKGESEDIAKVIDIATKILRCQMVCLPLMTFTVMSNMFLQTIGEVFRASFLAMCRQGLMLIPVLFLMRFLLTQAGGDPLWSVILAQPLADILSLGAALIVTIPVLRLMRKGITRQYDL